MLSLQEPVCFELSIKSLLKSWSSGCEYLCPPGRNAAGLWAPSPRAHLGQTAPAERGLWEMPGLVPSGRGRGTVQSAPRAGAGSSARPPLPEKGSLEFLVNGCHLAESLSVGQAWGQRETNSPISAALRDVSAIPQFWGSALGTRSAFNTMSLTFPSSLRS